MNKKLLVIGDSFCARRSREDDWPVALANMLNLELTGIGIPGGSWWFIRKKFLELVNTDDFVNSELVIFCHTEPHRIIGTDTTLNHHSDENQHICRIYYSYLQNEEFNHWACKQWFSELNTLVKNQKVIHLQNFRATDNYFSILDSIKLSSPCLTDISMQEVGAENSGVLISDHDRRNHFNTQTNKN